MWTQILRQKACSVCSMYNVNAFIYIQLLLANNHEINFQYTKLPRSMKYNGGGVDPVRLTLWKRDFQR